MIITIDGPAASGKSTVARLLAQQLDYYYLNSGLLYRALAYVMHDQDITHVSESGLLALLDPACFTYCSTVAGGAIIYKSQDITPYLKSPSIDQVASRISALKEVRQALLEFQRSFARSYSLVTDGRDCGTVVFPHADYKFFLIAAVEVRAARWQKDQIKKGINLSLKESQQRIEERDQRDSTRVLSPLVVAADAYIIDNSQLTQEQTVAVLFEHIQATQKARELR
ncbi:(d)CMP kinase [Candidatus Dependentiae bacterium]|nr:(d)CMP kinase [Candidatus Dependentiae bacterium]